MANLSNEALLAKYATATRPDLIALYAAELDRRGL